jgi:hypothetical protein
MRNRDKTIDYMKKDTFRRRKKPQREGSFDGTIIEN